MQQKPATDILTRYRLPDGRQAELDFLDSRDREDLLAGFRGLSSRSRYLRFFSAMPQLPDFIAEGLLATDPSNHVAIGARLIDSSGIPEPSILGVARYYRSSDSLTVAEPAIAVVDSLHGVGLGKFLLRKLSKTARANGITHFRAHVLGDNSRMKTLLMSAGAEVVEQEDAMLVYEVDIRESAAAPRGVLRRLLDAMLNINEAHAHSD